MNRKPPCNVAMQSLIVAAGAWRAPSPPLPVDVFTSGREGYPCYRIPAALRLANGHLLLFAEGRRGGDTGANDIVYKVSEDEGRSWSSLRVLHSEYNASGRSNDIHNPCPVIVNGLALVVFGRNRHNLLAKRALDANATRWGPVEDLTQMVFNTSAVSMVVPGPGAGVVIPLALHNKARRADAAAPSSQQQVRQQQQPNLPGERAIVPVAGPFGDGTLGGGVILSDDGGQTWRLSSRANPHGSEAQVALAPNGSLLLNSRGCRIPCHAGHAGQGERPRPARAHLRMSGMSTQMRACYRQHTSLAGILPSAHLQTPPVRPMPIFDCLCVRLACTGVRWQFVSHDAGETWLGPHVLDFGFGSSCEGSIISVPSWTADAHSSLATSANTSAQLRRPGAVHELGKGSPSLLFSHPGRINNEWNRWNLSVWRSTDSGATWTAIKQAEDYHVHCRVGNSCVHTAYSALLDLGGDFGRDVIRDLRHDVGVASSAEVSRGPGPSGIEGSENGRSEQRVDSMGTGMGMQAARSKVGLAYERGPMPGTHAVPTQCGEYATIRWQLVV